MVCLDQRRYAPVGMKGLRQGFALPDPPLSGRAEGFRGDSPCLALPVKRGRAVTKSATDILWVAICAGLVFTMQAGFMCLEAGVTRRKNNINVAMKNLSDFGISALIYWLFGY